MQYPLLREWDKEVKLNPLLLENNSSLLEAQGEQAWLSLLCCFCSVKNKVAGQTKNLYLIPLAENIRRSGIKPQYLSNKSFLA